MKIAVIPARGGSKRIPRKNLRDFCGRPILAWPIEAARASGLFDRVLVSTEDDRIAAAARAAGAEAPFVRPAELADDFTPTVDVVAHATEWALGQGWPLAAVCCIYPTAPLVAEEDLHRALALLEPGWDFAFTAVELSRTVLRSFRELPEGGVEMFFPAYAATRSQDLPRPLQDAGQFYWGSPAAWTGRRPLFGPRSRPLVIPGWRVRDIDEEEDWAEAEAIFARTRGSMR